MISQDTKNLFKRLVKAFRVRMLSGHWERKAFLLKQDHPDEIAIKEDGVRFNLIGLTLARDSFQFVLDRYDIIRTLQTIKSARFSIRDRLFFISVDGVTLNPTTAEELFIIEEIYVKGTYRFLAQRPCVVIDVGMNVGMASLFFASLKDVEKVYGFEPFLRTFEQAIVNFENNPALKDKIIPHSYGLSDGDRKLRLDYDYDCKGQAGILGTPLVGSGVNALENVEISVGDAARELRAILSGHEGKDFILKIDCEGSEYEIINRLAEFKLLNYFKVIIIEWHSRGPMDLIQILVAFGFLSFYNYSSNHKVGMIYASR